MTTVLAITVENKTGGVVYNRTALSQPILSAEARIQADSTDHTFVYGGNRLHYLFMDNSGDGRWPLTGRASMNMDRPLNRLPCVSHKMGSGSWGNTAVASPTVQTTIYNNIVATGNAIASWQTLNRGAGKWGATFVWAFHHECNQSTTITNEGGSLATAATNWRNAAQNILNIWRTVCGVTMWVGNNDWGTTQEGLIFCINLVSGKYSGRDGDISTFWGNNTFMDQNCVMYAGDPYNGSVNTRYTSFGDMVSGQKSWSAAKRIQQTAAGRPHLTGLYETGCSELSHFTNGEVANGAWTALGLGAFTKAKWLANMASYCETSWPDLSLHIYFDTYASTVDNLLDSSVASWNAWVANFANNPYFNIASDPIAAGPPPPEPTDFFPGVVPRSMRPKMGA